MGRYGGNYMMVRYVQLIQGLEDERLYGAADVVRTKYTTRHPRFEVMKRALWAFADNNNLKFTCDNAKRDANGRVITKQKKGGPVPVLLPRESWPRWYGRTWKTKLGDMERSLPHLLESLAVLLVLFAESKTADHSRRDEDLRHRSQETEPFEAATPKCPPNVATRHLQTRQDKSAVHLPVVTPRPFKTRSHGTNWTHTYLPRKNTAQPKNLFRSLKPVRVLAIAALIGVACLLMEKKPQAPQIETLTLRPLPILPAAQTSMMPPVIDSGANKN